MNEKEEEEEEDGMQMTAERQDGNDTTRRMGAG